MKFYFCIAILILTVFFAACSDGSGKVEDEAEEAVCGNGVVEEGEVCDGNEKSCSKIDSNFVSGTATCKPTCDGWDTSACKEEETEEAVCGNDIVEEGEVCDGNQKSCIDIDGEKYDGGKASCNDTCDGWDVETCEFCGNGVVDPGEECDGGAIDCSELGFLSGYAFCTDECKWDTSECLPQCGNGILEEGEECEVGDTMDCHEHSWLEYRGGEATCDPDNCTWDMSTCEPTFDVVPYGFINKMVVNTVNGIADSKRLCVPKEGEEEEGCDFDATYTLGRLGDTPLDISGGYANGSKVILTQPSGFDAIAKDSRRTCLAVNKGFDPLPEKFFTLFASIAFDRLTFQNIEMFGPQVVLMFNSDEISPGFYKITPFGEDGIIIAVGEQFDKTGDLDISSLCISAIGFGKKMDVKSAFNVMQDGGGGNIHYEGYDIPLYHPEETPIGDVTDMILEFGLEHVCDRH